MKIPHGGIAFFDSGIGGLTVLRECEKYFPNEIFYYYGDNVRAPYGNLLPETIGEYVREAFDQFLALNVKAAVVACNTVTAVCVEALRACYPFPIVGAEPAVFSAAKRGGQIYVLTTRVTYDSARFRALCRRAAARYPTAEMSAYPCDGLAGEIERHLTENGYDFTRLLPQGDPDAVVLGCTHYIYIKEIIRRFYGCDVYDGNEGIAQRLRAVLYADNEEKIQKANLFWKDRPLFLRNNHPTGQNAPLKPYLTTYTEFEQKPNVRLCVKSEKTVKYPLKQGDKRVFFLGSGQKINKNIREQMFVFD